MQVQSSKKELLAIAMEIEKNGYIFYRIAAQRGRDKGIRNTFQQLAGRETEHEIIVRELLTHTDTGTNGNAAESLDYIRSVTGSSIATGERARDCGQGEL